MMGMPVKKIQVFAGHSSVQQTMDYIRISDDDDDVINYLNRLSEKRMETCIFARFPGSKLDVRERALNVRGTFV